MPVLKATKQLLEACEVGNLEQMKASVRLGADTTVYSDTKNFSPALHLCRGGYLECLQWLIGNSSSPIDLTLGQSNALRLAAIYNQLEMARWLLESSGQQLDLLAKDCAAIHVGIRHGHTELVQYLVNECPQAHRLRRRRSLAPEIRSYFDEPTFQLCQLLRQEQDTKHTEITLQFDVLLAPLATQLAELQQQIQTVKQARTTQHQQLADALRQKAQAVKRSPFCRKALEAGFVTTVADLDDLLQKDPQTDERRLKTTRL